jgi:Iap family predicted aminopeptidase
MAGLIVLAASPSGAQQPQPSLATADEIKAEFAAVPCKNEDRLNAATALFEKMGAPASDISVDKHGSVENLVVRKQGSSQELIVIGAHYDKVRDGCGAIDNWTGIVVVAHLYQSLKSVPLKKTILFVAFGREEEGLVGSRAMVAAIKKDQIGQYCEMINFDSFGLAPPQVADNMSSKKLGTLAADIARELKIPFNHAAIPNADADSSSFIGRKIPAVTLHGLNSDWPRILHSIRDQAAKINPVSVYLGYRLALAMVIRLDESACGAYR